MLCATVSLSHALYLTYLSTLICVILITFVKELAIYSCMCHENCFNCWPNMSIGISANMLCDIDMTCLLIITIIYLTNNIIKNLI